MNTTIEVTIEETLNRTIAVQAETMEDALAKVRKMYDNEEIVLDYNDIMETEFFVH